MLAVKNADIKRKSWSSTESIPGVNAQKLSFKPKRKDPKIFVFCRKELFLASKKLDIS